MRKKRMHPFKDDKVLADWNALMIAALAKGARIFGNKEYLKSAKKALDFIMDKMSTDDYRLRHRYRDGDIDIEGYLDDYAFLIFAQLEMYETTFDTKYLKNALKFNKVLIFE